RKAEEFLRSAHAVLERKVAERTVELEAANSRLKELDRLKSEFVANMSHELRTPLNSIIGFAELLETERVGRLRSDQRACLADILGSAQHLLRLINDLLDMAKVEAGKLELERETVDIAGLLRRTADSMRTLAAEK